MDVTKRLPLERAFCRDNRDGRTWQWSSERGEKYSSMNADQKKEMVKTAKLYFIATITPDVAVRSLEFSI